MTLFDTARWSATTGWTSDTAGAIPLRWGLYGHAPMRRVGKKAAGRTLDGRTWDEYPQRVPA